MTEYATNDEATSNVILAGAVGDYGTATRSVSDNHLVLALTHGHVTLDIGSITGKFKTAVGGLVVNQQTCSAVAAATGSASVVDGSGTEQYAGLSGSFDVTMTLDEVYHPGACQESAPYLSQVVILTGWGTLTVS